uniref:Lipocalin/cytosolic fatty-acid binding domain-containing protein n=1 Tax=Bos indicus x Bos taurus TaxID=30522 RepID=A0A4W2BNJ8_BOBOX
VKVLFLTLVLVCAFQETPAETDASQVCHRRLVHHLHTADNKERVVEGGPLRCYCYQTECNNDCTYLSPTFYVKIDGRCRLSTQVLKRQEAGIYLIECEYSNADTNVLQLIHVPDNMLVIYFENDDGQKITKITIGTAKGDNFTQEELQKYQEPNNERGIPNENIENVIEAGEAPEDNRYLKMKTHH